MLLGTSHNCLIIQIYDMIDVLTEIIATSENRLDALIASQVSGISRSKAQKLIKNGKVKVSGNKMTKTAFHVKQGDEVIVEAEKEEEKSDLKPAGLRLKVLYEDPACLVIDKPAGIAVHPSPTSKEDEKTILHGVAHLFKKEKIKFTEDAVLVHRLDRDTTGCLLIAKNAVAHKQLQKQFEERTVSKTYLAIVAGVPNPASAVIDAPIGRNLTDRTKMSVLKTSVSREARTTYRTLDATDRTALLSCDLHTGRTHQIRVHLSSIGHPILGDPTYLSHSSDNLSKEMKIKNLCLHAFKLKFVSPADGQEHEIEAPVPADFKDALRKCQVSCDKFQL